MKSRQQLEKAAIRRHHRGEDWATFYAQHQAAAEPSIPERVESWSAGCRCCLWPATWKASAPRDWFDDDEALPRCDVQDDRTAGVVPRDHRPGAGAWWRVLVLQQELHAR